MFMGHLALHKPQGWRAWPEGPGAIHLYLQGTLLIMFCTLSTMVATFAEAHYDVQEYNFHTYEPLNATDLLRTRSLSPYLCKAQ